MMPLFSFEDWAKFYKCQFWVSHFPKWLGEEGATAEPFIYYGEAKSKRLVDDFLPIESNFLSFYRSLIGTGPVMFNHYYGRSPFTGEYRQKHFAKYGKQVEQFLRKQIREETKLGLFDEILIPRLGMHVHFNHDMTHICYLAEPDKEAEIEARANEYGLHILR